MSETLTEAVARLNLLLRDQSPTEVLPPGLRGNPDGCPVARWLKESGQWRPCVTSCKVSSNGVSMYLPYFVEKFIRQFDRGEWPMLIQNRRTVPDSKSELAPVGS